MGVLVNMREIDGATVVRLAGSADPGALERVGEGIVGACTDGGKVIVVDINELTLADRSAFERLVGPLQNMPVRILCRRSAAYTLLREWKLDGRVPIFRTLTDALDNTVAGASRSPEASSHPPAERTGA
jgi:hypothetical protein